MLVDAIGIMKCYTCEVGNESEHQNYAYKINIRVMEALIRNDGRLKITINGTHILYDPIRLHGIDLYGMYIFYFIQEETSILIFNMALTYKNY